MSPYICGPAKQEFDRYQTGPYDHIVKLCPIKWNIGQPKTPESLAGAVQPRSESPG